MANNCCNLVGNFDIKADGIISVSSKGATPVQLFTSGGNSALAIAPSSGSVSITAYAGTVVHSECAAKAGVSVNWITRTDCDKNIYLFGGPGKSYIQGPTAGLAYFPSLAGVNNPVNEYEIVDASSSSGPASMYTVDVQQDGFGLVFDGTPWRIDTTIESDCIIDLSSWGIGGYGKCMLQSLNLTCTPGQVPTVNLDFVYSIDN